MSYKLTLAVLSVALVPLIFGCERNENALNAVVEIDTPGLNSIHQMNPDLNNQLEPYKITFEGRLETSDSTTFTWNLYGSAEETSSRTFMIQLPECAPDPLSYNPKNGTIIDPGAGPFVRGIAWNLTTQTENQDYKQYSITLPGAVPLGEVFTSISTAETENMVIAAGPCQGSDIAGQVFIDANNDGVLNPDQESGIANVVIELTDSAGNTQIMVTDQFGKYSIRKLEGNYTLRLDTEGYPNFFNNQLAESFEATTTLMREVTVPPGSPDNNFGFNTDYETIVVDIYNGDLPADGKKLSYWREEFRKVLFDDEENRYYSGRTLLELLEEINNLSLKSVHSFTPGHELIEAYEILTVEEPNFFSSLQAELLATELNHVIDRGLVEHEELQLVLISWGEALLAQDQTDPAGGFILVNPDEYIQATRLYKLINTGGGGGVDE